MLKIIVLASILGMLLPALGHHFSRSVKNDWLRFVISILFLGIAIAVSYAIALWMHW